MSPGCDLHINHKAVAAFGNGLNEVVSVAVVAKNFS